MKTTKRKLKYVKGITIHSYPSIDELLKQSPGKTIEEYIEMQNKFIQDKLEEEDKRIENIVEKVNLNKNKCIYTKETYEASRDVYFCKNYNFVLTDCYYIDYTTKTIQLAANQILCGTQSRRGFEWEDITTSKTNRKVIVITEEEFNKVFNITKNTFTALNLLK